MGVFSWGFSMYGKSMSSLAQRLEMALTNSPQRIDQKQLATMLGKDRRWITDVKAGSRKPGEPMAVELPVYREEMNALVTAKNHASQKLKRLIDFVAGEDIAPTYRKGMVAQITTAQRSLDDIEHQIAKKEGEIAAKEVTAGHITMIDMVIKRVQNTLQTTDIQTINEILSGLCEKIRISRKKLHLSLYIPQTNTPDSEESGVDCSGSHKWWAVLRGVQTFGIDLDLVKLCLAS
jgi:hypothetical protein